MSNYLQLRRYSTIHLKKNSGIESRRQVSFLAKFLVFLDSRELSFEQIVQSREPFEHATTAYVTVLKQQNRTGRYIHDALGAINDFAEFIQAGWTAEEGPPTLSREKRTVLLSSENALENRVLCKLLMLLGLDGNQCRSLKLCDIRGDKIYLSKRRVELTFTVPADLIGDITELRHKRYIESQSNEAPLFITKEGKPLSSAALAYRLKILGSALGARLSPSILKRSYRLEAS